MSVGTTDLTVLWVRCVHCDVGTTAIARNMSDAIDQWTELGWRLYIVASHWRAACPKCVRRGA